ncbi:MAG: collagen binding domain-containing protein, partial [Clostridium sp.]
VVLEDRMPLGMEVMNNQVTIYKDAGGREINVTNSFKDKITVERRDDGHQWVKVIFGDLSSNDRYKVQYKGKVVEAVESNRYENDVTLTWDEGQAKDSCIVHVRQPQKGKETLKKTVDGNNEQVEVIPNPDTGKLQDKEYTLLINDKLEDKKNTVLTDVIPAGMKLKTDSVRIKKHVGGNTYKDVTNEFKGRTETSDNLLIINFGDISDRYKVTYKVEIVEPMAEGYKNTAKLDYEINGISKSEEDSALVIPILPDKTPKPEDAVISKGTTEQGVTVSQVGDKVQYEIKINEDKRNLNEVVIEDIIPQGMSLLQEDFQVIMSGDYGTPRDITGELKRVEENPGVGEYVLSKENLTINLGNIDSMYTIRYKTIVDVVKNLYENKAIFNSTEIVKTAVNKVDYVISTGGLNAMKEADKSVLLQSENQEVIYTIKVWNSFLLPEKAIKISDSLDSRVKFIEVYGNDAFSITYDTATHTVTAENNVDLPPVERENAYEIKIKVSFEQVNAGETVRNIAKVNGTNTAPVEVKKGYKFKAFKVDGDDETTKLSGARFQLLDEDKKILKELVSDDRGVIESDIETAGTYYLREVMAPHGYELLMEDIKFEITEAQAGEVVNIGNIKNYEMGPVEDGTDDDNMGVIPPIEEGPSDEGLEEKPPIEDGSEGGKEEIETPSEDETDKDNPDKDNSGVKPELPQAGGKSGSLAILLGFMAVIAGFALRKKL